MIASAPPAIDRGERLREWLATAQGVLACALVVGVGAGLGAIGFRELIIGLTELFSGHHDYSAAGHAINPHVPWLGLWFVVLAPAVGGLLHGPLVARFAPEARGRMRPPCSATATITSGTPWPRVPVIKALASALTIGSGGSVGREGPIVQIGAALGSVLGQLARLPVRQLRLLVACGAAGGIAATFNAPIAGVFFALEVILGDFEAAAFGTVVLSSVTAAAIARGVFGTASFLSLPSFTLVSPVELVLYAGLGIAGGVVGVAFIRLLYGAEDAADRLWRGPAWARPAAGGLLLGLVLLAVPQMYGVGYPVLTHAVEGHYLLAAVLGLMVAKVVATSLTLAVGGSGGVFAPSLFVGAMLGSAFGQVAHGLLPGIAAPAGAYALVGMGAVFAGSARAPITAVLIVFELTGEYSIILPLMLAVVVATIVGNRLCADTIYTLKLTRRGIRIRRPRVVSVMRTVTVGDAMRPIDEQRLDGSVPALPRDAVIHADDTLEDAVRALAVVEHDGVPVFAPGGDEVVGWIGHRAVLSAYHAERQRLSSATAAPGAAPATVG